MTTATIDISTNNKNLGRDIEVTIEVEVPESWEEAVAFYGDEEKAIKAVQTDVARRRANAARPALRDATTEADFTALATKIAAEYQPGRRSGFGAVELSEDELNVDSLEALKAVLIAKGVKITA